ncbi:MAG: hypothetical protein FWC10_10315 [Lentimicrobiaceae bacterium]|nr:hypothetical protein [Lentimicrobiaceae bacterium]
MKRIPKCSKCKAEPFRYVEAVEEFTVFDVYDGVLECKGDHEPGFPLRVEANCECGHVWVLRHGIFDLREVYRNLGRLND